MGASSYYFSSDRLTRRWYHQQESNLYLALRRHSFYPLNYGGGESFDCKGWDALHNSLRMGVVQVGMSCKAHFAAQ